MLGKRGLFFLKKILSLLLCTGMIGILISCSPIGDSPTSALAPDFTLQTLEGEEVTLSKLKGKALLLDFWATWCAPCREAIPHLIQLHKDYKDKGLVVIGLSVDKGGVDTVRNFARSMDIPYSILLTPDEVVRNYGVTGIPTTIFIDKEGKIRDKLVGFNSTVANQMAARAAELTSE